MTTDIHMLISEGGGEIAGKVRLQKIVYLLDQLGLESGFEFEYHHYGPYSEALFERVSDEIAFHRIEVIQRRRQSDGVPYVVYRLPNKCDKPGHSLSSRLRSALERMQATSATVLELAATAHWLAVVEEQKDWPSELQKRKGAKLNDGRREEALTLLKEFGLPPAA